ncbi:MAG: hypothetical protein AAFY65_14145 [Pseudomonadota bacterium]
MNQKYIQSGWDIAGILLGLVMYIREPFPFGGSWIGAVALLVLGLSVYRLWQRWRPTP